MEKENKKYEESQDLMLRPKALLEFCFFLYLCCYDKDSLSNQTVANKKEIVLSLLETKLVQIGIIQKFDSISGEKGNCLNSFKDKRSANIVKCLNSEDIRCNH